MGPITYDAWALCRQMKLVIKFLNGTSDAKIKNPVRVVEIGISSSTRKSLLIYDKTYSLYKRFKSSVSHTR